MVRVQGNARTLGGNGNVGLFYVVGGRSIVDVGLGVTIFCTPFGRFRTLIGARGQVLYTITRRGRSGLVRGLYHTFSCVCVTRNCKVGTPKTRYCFRSSTSFQWDMDLVFPCFFSLTARGPTRSSNGTSSFTISRTVVPPSLVLTTADNGALSAEFL